METGEAGSRLFDAAFLRALERLRLAARRPLDAQYRAERRSPRAGTSLEFAEHRNYAGGDDPRMLDWNAYGRLDRLFVKLFHDEEAMEVVLVVDASASMRCAVESGATRSRFDQARQLAAVFAYVALAGQHQVSLAGFGEAAGRRVGPLRGRAGFHEVLRFLEAEDWPSGATDLVSGVREATTGIRRRNVTVVLSDFLGGYETALRGLLHRRFEVVAVRVFDPAEVGAELSGDLLLVDAETGVELTVNAGAELLTRRRREEAAFAAEFRAWCRGSGIGCFEASCAESLEDTLRGLQRSGVLLR